MLKKFLVVIAALCGGAFGDFGAWVFHYILDANADYITGHKWLVAFVGTAGLLFFGNIIHDTKIRSARIYGLLVLGIACGIFMQAIFYSFTSGIPARMTAARIFC